MRKRENACKQCGWKYPGFHICLDLSKPSEAERKALAETNGARRSHLAKTDRNDEIVKLYAEGYTFQMLSDKYGVSKQTIGRIVHRAADMGQVSVRSKGGRPILVEGGV